MFFFTAAQLKQKIILPVSGYTIPSDFINDIKCNIMTNISEKNRVLELLKKLP